MRRDDRQPNAVFSATFSSSVLVDAPGLTTRGMCHVCSFGALAVQGDRRRRAAWEALEKTDEGHR